MSEPVPAAHADVCGCPRVFVSREEGWLTTHIVGCSQVDREWARLELDHGQ